MKICKSQLVSWRLTFDFMLFKERCSLVINMTIIDTKLSISQSATNGNIVFFVVLHCLFSFSTTLLASSQSSFPLYNPRLSEVSLDGVFSLGQYYEWQMKWGKFDGNKSGFILIYAASCRFSCPADDCNCKTWARGKASSFPPGQD